MNGHFRAFARHFREIKTLSGVTKPQTRAYAYSIAKAYREMADIYQTHGNSIDFHLEAVADYERLYQAKLTGDAKALRDKGTIAKLKVLKDVVRCQSQAKDFERTGARLP